MRLIFIAMLWLVIGPGIAVAASLEVMAGQMILVGFRGDGANDAGVKAVQSDIANGRIGGVLYLKTNVASLNAVRDINRGFVAASKGLVPLIALDQEGGSIERLTQAVGFTEIPSAARIASNQSVAGAQQTYFTMARGLAEVGFNVNFGPVVDLNLNPNNPIIARYGRSYGAVPGQVAKYAGSFIDAHHQAGLVTALKHFPGHGSSRSDSHEGFVDISQVWQPQELDPYRILINQGKVDMVMMAHLYHRQFSGAGAQTPASLSPNWIEGVLRQQLGYDGVVVSDDMEMGAIRAHFSFQQSIIMAVEAGTDILLFSNTANYRSSLGQEIRDILVAKAESDPSFRARIEQSYRRIVGLKARL